jgi:pimeloyl-ACP methyl ester carboxylesterase
MDVANTVKNSPRKSRKLATLSQTTTGTFVSSDGVRLGFTTGGNPNGPPVLFCYGLVCSSFHFKYQWEFLEKNYRLLMLDYRGHHVSEDPAAITTITFARMAEDLNEFLEHENVLAPVTVVGHSMGVNIAIELYARFAERVSSLVLIAGAATFPANKPAELKRLSVAHSAMQILDGLFGKFADDLWKFQIGFPGLEYFAGFMGFNPKLSKADDVKGVIKAMSGFSPRIFFQLLGQYIKHDRMQLLPKINVPVLIVGGEKDKMVPWRFQEQLHENIKHSKLFCVKDGSHVPQFDRPDEVNRELGKFLKSLVL